MNVKRLVRLFALSGAAMSIVTVPGFPDQGHCRQVGGSVITNFTDIDATHTIATGPVFGDLKGAVAVEVLSINGNTYHISKNMVTDTGDTLAFFDTDFITYPTATTGLFGAVETIDVKGGTGRFAGAEGFLSFFGAIDGGQVTLRYAGTLCFPKVKEP
jgi:hypothetical protein